MSSLPFSFVLVCFMMYVLANEDEVWGGDRDYRFLVCLAACEVGCDIPKTFQPHPDITPSLKVNSTRIKTLIREAATNGTVDLQDRAPDFYAHMKEETQMLINQLGSAKEVLSVVQDALLERGFSYATPPGNLSRWKRLTFWSCDAECRYQCMIENRDERARSAEISVKYFGKWPFDSVLGCQEIVSSLFSVLNGIPHGIFFFSCCKPGAPVRNYRYFRIWWMFSFVVFFFTWPCSALFHCRDHPVTETMDYLTAQLGVCLSVGVTLTQLFLPHSNCKQVLNMFAVPLTAWTLHMLYMLLVEFDYDWNMIFAVSLGALSSSLWVRWYFLNRKIRPHAWILLVPTLGVYPLLILFELRDFAPSSLTSHLVDAHACWHITTLPLSFAWYQFVQRDYQWELEKAGAPGGKPAARFEIDH